MTTLDRIYITKGMSLLATNIQNRGDFSIMPHCCNPCFIILFECVCSYLFLLPPPQGKNLMPHKWEITIVFQNVLCLNFLWVCSNQYVFIPTFFPLILWTSSSCKPRLLEDFLSPASRHKLSSRFREKGR